MPENLRRFLMVLLIGVFCFSAVKFTKSLWEYYKGNEIYASARKFVIEAGSDTQKEEKETTQIDFSGLQKMNKEVLGWITIPGTTVDYPLLDADDNSYYLTHSYDRQWSSYGSIFLEQDNAADLMDSHIILYGHNMKNGAMFGSLADYKEQGYADSHNIIKIALPGAERTYRVFSAYTAHVDSHTYEKTAGESGVYQRMIGHMKSNSIIQTDITPKFGEQILTLSTCTPAGDEEYRFVVNAVLIEPPNITNQKVGEEVEFDQ